MLKMMIAMIIVVMNVVERVQSFPIFWNVDESVEPKIDVTVFDFRPRNFTQVGNGCSNLGCKSWTQGAFPTIDDNGMKHFGGVPQAGNLTQHLELFRKGLETWIPDESWVGNAVLDFESWTTVWEMNSNIGSWHSVRYQNESIRLVREAHPDWSDEKIEATAKKEFETAATEYFVESLRLGREMRPNARWGFYDLPTHVLYPCNESGCAYSGPDAATLQDYSNRQADIFNASSALFPSVYLPDGLLQRPENVTAYIRAMVTESLRVGGGIRNDKPIFPYAWHYYHSGNVLQTVNTTVEVLETVFHSGGDGIVFWGGVMNDTYWQWLQNQCGPATKKWCDSVAGGCLPLLLTQ